MEYEMYQDGIVVCQKGDEANELYLIISGTCVVTINGKKISSMNELEIFGESALFPGENGVAVRSATVTCVGNVQLLSLSKEKFDYLVDSGSLNENCMIKLRQVLKDHKEADLKKKKSRDASDKDSIEKIRIEIVSRVKTEKKLKKIFQKIDLDKSNSIDKEEFQALLTATMAVTLEDVLFEKVWNVVLNTGNEDGKRKNSIDLLGLKSWLFGKKK